jgi:hypothetical protein
LIGLYNFQPVESVVVGLHLALHFPKVYFFGMIFYVCEVYLFPLLHHSQRLSPDLFLRLTNLLSFLCHFLVKSGFFSSAWNYWLSLVTNADSFVIFTTVLLLMTENTTTVVPPKSFPTFTSLSLVSPVNYLLPLFLLLLL